jgi:hypothetical protein
VLDITINTEVDFIQLLKSSSSNDREKKVWDVIHQHDDPENISLLPSIDPTKVTHLLKRLDFIIIQEEQNNDDLTKFDHWQTQVLFRDRAFIYCVTNNFI